MSKERDFIPYGRQSISEADIEAVVSVLKSDYLTQGPVVPAFEKEIAERCKVAHAVAVNSATSALHLACLALGVGEGDIAWTVPTTFVASANCARYCGADVDFVDIDSNTWCMCPQKLEDKLRSVRSEGASLPKVVIPVHLSGQSCDMKSIHSLSHEYGFSIIEDASHAIGGKYLDEPVGSCKYSDITVFSFHPVKIITSGEGGIAVTNSDRLHQQIVLLRSHGITRDRSMMTSKVEDGWYYEQLGLGYNYRLTDIHAALGLSQLGRLVEFVDKRNTLAKAYTELAWENVSLQLLTEGAYSSRHLFPVRVSALKRDAVFNKMRSCKVGVNLHYLPVHLQPYYKKLGFGSGMFPESEAYALESISLPLHPRMSHEEQLYVHDNLMEHLQ